MKSLKKGERNTSVIEKITTPTSDKIDDALKGSDYFEGFEKQVNPCFIMDCINHYHSSDFIITSISFSGIYG
jgi:hypothetical protein